MKPKGLTNLGGQFYEDPTTILTVQFQGELEMNVRPAFPLLLVLLFSTFGYASAQTNTVWSWCLSDSEQPVYVSRPFDSGMKKLPSFNGTSLGRQFAEYLRGRFDIKTTASCSTAGARDQASVTQRVQSYVADMRRQNKQVVELSDWNYIPDQVAIDASFDPKGDPTYVNVEGNLPQDRFYCVSDTFQNTVYYGEPFLDKTPSVNPSVGYFQMLQQKYGYKGQMSCLLASVPKAALFLKARLDGARAGGKKIVTAGWPTAGSSTATQIKPKDNDDEPPSPPPAKKPPPTADVLLAAIKEISPALTFCQATRALLVSYDCACLQTKIYDYRIAHPAETLRGTPALAGFFDGKLIELATCMTDARAKTEARNRAVSAGLKLPAQQECAADKFVALLHGNPVPSLAASQLDSAIKACR